MSGLHPYYEGAGGVVIYHGDCLEVLSELGQVDHVIMDPPYAPRAMKNARSGSTIKQRRDGQIYDFGYEALTPEVRQAVAVLVGDLALGWVISWCDIESASAWREALELACLRYVRTGVWVREHGAPQFSGDRPAQGVETCVIAHAGGVRMAWNGGGRPATWIGPIVSSQSGDRLHSSPKPLWLMRQLIEDFTDPGDTILDPFMGSGTTLRAAKDLGRKAIGIEIEERYCEIAAQRLSQEVLSLHEVMP